MNHRGLQRALFRMRMDPAFCAALLAGDPATCASTDLGAQELLLLSNLDPAALHADRGGAGREQALRNLSSEYALSCSLAGAEVAMEFFGAGAFHAAIREADALPLAFGRYLLGRLRGQPEARAIARLEWGMAVARRELREAATPAAGEVALAPWARLVQLPSGSFAHALQVREALDRGRAPRRRAPARPPGEAASETVLLVASAERPPFGLRRVEPECLTALVAGFLERALAPQDARARRDYAEGADADPEDLELLCTALLNEAVLVGSLRR